MPPPEHTNFPSSDGYLHCHLLRLRAHASRSISTLQAASGIHCHLEQAESASRLTGYRSPPRHRPIRTSRNTKHGAYPGGRTNPTTCAAVRPGTPHATGEWQTASHYPHIASSPRNPTNAANRGHVRPPRVRLHRPRQTRPAQKLRPLALTKQQNTAKHHAGGYKHSAYPVQVRTHSPKPSSPAYSDNRLQTRQ